MWKSHFLRMVVTGLLVLGLSAAVLAQNNWGQNLTGKTESLTGTVFGVDLTPPNTSLRVQVDGAVLTVELGPAWFVEAFSVSVGDEVTIVGGTDQWRCFGCLQCDKKPEWQCCDPDLARCQRKACLEWNTFP